MKNINFKLGLVAIAVTVSPLGTFATTTGNPAVVNLLPPPAGVTCTGVVLDNTGESVIGASVKVLGTKMGTVTDMDGKFTLANVAKGATIEISYIGYTPQQVKFNGTPLTITLKEDAKALDEVVGCIAGDDTIMVAVRTVEDTQILMDKIHLMIER